MADGAAKNTLASNNVTRGLTFSNFLSPSLFLQGMQVGFAEADCAWAGALEPPQPSVRPTPMPSGHPTVTPTPTVTPAPTAPSPVPSPAPTPPPTPLPTESDKGSSSSSDEEGGATSSAAANAAVGVAVSVLLAACLLVACGMATCNAAKRHRERRREAALARQRGEMPSSGDGDDLGLFDKAVGAVVDMPCAKRLSEAVRKRLNSGRRGGGGGGGSGGSGAGGGASGKLRKPKKRGSRGGRFQKLGSTEGDDPNDFADGDDDEEAPEWTTSGSGSGSGSGSVGGRERDLDDIDSCVDVELPAHRGGYMHTGDSFGGGGIVAAVTTATVEENFGDSRGGTGATTTFTPSDTELPALGSSSGRSVASAVFNPFRSRDPEIMRIGEGSEF